MMHHAHGRFWIFFRRPTRYLSSYPSNVIPISLSADPARSYLQWQIKSPWIYPFLDSVKCIIGVDF